MMRSILFVCSLVFITFSNLNAKNHSIKVVKETSTELIIEAQFDKPIQKIVNHKDKNIATIKIPGLLQTDKIGSSHIPFASKQFSLPAEELNSEVIEIKTESMPANKILELVQNDNQNTKKYQFYSIEYSGIFRDIPIYNLNIFPVKINSNQIVWINKIKIRIWIKTNNTNSNYSFDAKKGKEKQLLEKMLLNGKNINYKTSSTTVPLEKTYQRYQSGKYKILVDKDAIYQVTYQDLIDAGMDLKSINPKKLRLSNKGQEVAIYFKGSSDLSFDDGDYFEFWGEKNKNTFLDQYPDMYSDPFTDVNVYWLEESNSAGQRMVEENGALIVSNPALYRVPQSFKEKLHFEKDSHYEHFGQLGASLDGPSNTLDLWYYDSGIIADGNYSYDFFLPYPYNQGNTVFVKAVFRGRSYRDEKNPLNSHEVLLRINEGSSGNRIGESGKWENQEMHIIQNSNGISQSFINHGTNSLKVYLTQEDSSISDIVLLNWFDVEYLRKYRAYNNSIIFRRGYGYSTDRFFQFEVDGFNNPNIEIYKNGVSKIVNSRIDYYTDDNGFRSYRVSFQDSIFYSGIEYVAITKNQKKKPIDIIPDNPWIPNALTDVSLLDQVNSSDYLIITSELLFENVLQLKQFHEQNGLNTSIVKVQDIYDEFNYGIKSPLAIKEFIKYVFNNWDQSHRLYFVNLVGTASEYYKKPTSSKPDLVPTLFFQTKKYGASASDFQYSLVSGGEFDEIPDIIVARIPAKNNTEFLNYMDKLTEYTSYSDKGDWTNKVLLISGNDAKTLELNSYPHAFRAQNQRIINYKIPDEYFIRKLNTVRDSNLVVDPNYGSTTDLINYFDDGLTYINFFGHGGGGIWADVELFDDNDIERLNNGAKLPFVSSMTCFTGAFENKSMATIADKLVTAANKGAIGVYASSGVGWLHNDFAVSWPLTEYLFDKKLTIGESVLLSKIYYLSNAIYYYDDGTTSLYDYGNLRKSMVNQYNLLGEPNIYLPDPDNNLTINIDNNLVQVNDTINVKVVSPYSSGELTIELTNENNEPLFEASNAIQSTGNNFSIIIPPEMEEQIGYIKAFAYNNNNNSSHGSAKIAVQKSLLDSVTVFPENPKIGQQINLFVHVHSKIPIQTVLIKNLEYINNKQPDLILAKISDTLYTTSTSLGPFNKGGKWNFSVEIEDTAGNIATYHQQSFTIIDSRPDLDIVDNSFNFTGTNEIQITAQIINNSDENIIDTKIGFFDSGFVPGETPFYYISENFLAKQKKTITFPIDISLLTLNKKYTVVADYEYLLEESDESNNIDSSLVYKSFVFIQSNIGTNDTLNINDIAKIYIEPNALTSNTTLAISSNYDSDLLKSDSQPGFHYIPFGNTKDSITISFKINNVAAKLVNQAYVAFKIDTSMSADSLNHLGIYRYSDALSQWIKVPNDSIKNDCKFVKTNTLGNFALFYVNDIESPVIEITINGRALRNNMLVPSTPELAVILQDENGIDITNGFFIKIDDDTVSRTDMNIPDSVAISNAISVLTSPYFSKGEHTLSVEAIDANGNKTIKPINFTTSGNFDVKVYGNYPNPFKDDTYISYFVDSNDRLDEFSVKIYTISGRMIKDFDTSDERFRLPDYYEIYWDGRDNDGNLVANGVYFAVIKAKFEGNEVEHRLKLAKLK